MTKFKEITKKVRFEIFPIDLIIVVSNDVKQSRSNRNKLLGVIPHDHYSAFHYQCGTTSYIFLKYDATPGIIAHEAFHCVWSIFEVIGAEHNNEVMAYTLWFIVNDIHKFIKEKWRT